MSPLHHNLELHAVMFDDRTRRLRQQTRTRRAKRRSANQPDR